MTLQTVFDQRFQLRRLQFCQPLIFDRKNEEKALTVRHLAKDIERELQMGWRVRRGNAKAEPRRTLRHCWKEDGSGQDAVIAEPSCKERSGHFIFQDEGNDRGLGEPGVIAQVAQATTEEVGVLRGSCHTLRFLRENGQSFADRRH